MRVLLFLVTFLFLGLLPPVHAEETEGEAQVFFHQLPQMVVNLKSDGYALRKLKMTVNIEVESDADLQLVQKLEPRVMNEFQMYLRRMATNDFESGTSLYRIKNALLERANQSASPAKVKDILFKELLVQ